MFEDTAANVLSAVLGEFVEIDSDQLKVKVWAGDVVLEDLRIRPDALDALHLPLAVRAGKITRLVLKANWRKLKTTPVRIEIHGLYVLVTPRDDDEFDEVVESEREHARKMRKLEGLELRKADGGDADAHADDLSPSSKQGFKEKLITKIIDNLQVSIDKVHIRYEDRLPNGDRVAAGLTLSALNFQSMGADGQSFSSGGANFVKRGMLDSMAVYFNVRPPTPAPPPAQTVGGGGRRREAATSAGTAMLDGSFVDLLGHPDQLWRNMALVVASNQARHSEHANLLHYILPPTHGDVWLKVEKNQTTRDVPRVQAQVAIDNVALQLRSNQYHAMTYTAGVFSNYNVNYKYRRFRPTTRPSEDSAGWWRYVLTVAHEIAKEKLAPYKPGFIERRRRMRLRYMDLWSTLKTKGKLKKTRDREEFEALERILSYEDIRFFRLIAEAALEKQKLVKEVKKATKTSWFPFGRKKNAAEAAAAAANVENLLDEGMREIAEAIDYDAEDVDQQFYDPTYVIANIKWHLKSGSLAIGNSSDQPTAPLDIFRVAFTDFFINVLKRSTSQLIEGRLGAFVVEDTGQAETLYRRVVYPRGVAADALPSPAAGRRANVVRSNPARPQTPSFIRGGSSSTARPEGLGDPLLNFSYESTPHDDESVSSRVNVRFSPLDVVVNAGVFGRVAAFLDGAESNIMQDLYKRYRKRIKFRALKGFEDVIDVPKAREVNVEIAAPLILVPESVTHHSHALLFDLGRLEIRGQVDTPLIDDAYSKYSVDLHDVGVSLRHTSRPWMAADGSGVDPNGGIVVIDNIGVAILGGTLLDADAHPPEMPRSVIDTTLPPINFRISDWVYGRVVSLFDASVRAFASAASLANSGRDTLVQVAHRRAEIGETELGERVPLGGVPSNQVTTKLVFSLQAPVLTLSFLSETRVDIATPGTERELMFVTVANVGATLMYRAVDQTLNVKVVDFAVVDRLIEDPDRQLIVRHLVPYNVDAAAAVYGADGTNVEAAAAEAAALAAATPFIDFTYHRVDPASGAFRNVYNGIKERVRFSLGSLAVDVNPRSLQRMVRFAEDVLSYTTASTYDALAGSVMAMAEASAKRAKRTATIHVELVASALTLNLNRAGETIIVARMEGTSASYVKSEAFRRVVARLGSLTLEDYSDNESPYKFLVRPSANAQREARAARGGATSGSPARSVGQQQQPVAWDPTGAPMLDVDFVVYKEATPERIFTQHLRMRLAAVDGVLVMRTVRTLGDYLTFMERLGSEVQAQKVAIVGDSASRAAAHVGEPKAVPPTDRPGQKRRPRKSKDSTTTGGFALASFVRKTYFDVEFERQELIIPRCSQGENTSQCFKIHINAASFKTQSPVIVRGCMSLTGISVACGLYGIGTKIRRLDRAILPSFGCDLYYQGRDPDPDDLAESGATSVHEGEGEGGVYVPPPLPPSAGDVVSGEELPDPVADVELRLQVPELTFRLSELDYEVLLGVLKENANEAVIRPLCSSTTLGGSSMGASARRRFSSDESDGGDDADAQAGDGPDAADFPPDAQPALILSVAIEVPKVGLVLDRGDGNTIFRREADTLLALDANASHMELKLYSDSFLRLTGYLESIIAMDRRPDAGNAFPQLFGPPARADQAAAATPSTPATDGGGGGDDDDDDGIVIEEDVGGGSGGGSGEGSRNSLSLTYVRQPGGKKNLVFVVDTPRVVVVPDILFQIFAFFHTGDVRSEAAANANRGVIKRRHDTLGASSAAYSDGDNLATMRHSAPPGFGDSLGTSRSSGRGVTGLAASYAPPRLPGMRPELYDDFVEPDERPLTLLKTIRLLAKNITASLEMRSAQIYFMEDPTDRNSRSLVVQTTASVTYAVNSDRHLAFFLSLRGCEVYRSNFYTPFHGTSLIKPFVIGLEVDDGNRGDGGGGGGGGGGLQDGEDELVAESVAVEAELDPVEIRFSYEDMRFMLSLALLYSEQFDKVLKDISSLAQGGAGGATGSTTMPGPASTLAAEMADDEPSAAMGAAYVRSKVGPIDVAGKLKKRMFKLVEAMSSIHAAESLAGSETFTLTAPSVQVSLIDDRLALNVPVVSVRFENTRVEFANWSRGLNTFLWTRAEVNLYNRLNAHWEPLLEPWNFHVKFNLKSEFADTLYVAFSSGDPLRLNVAPHFVRTANAVVDIAKKQYKALADRGLAGAVGGSGDDDDDLGYPFVIRNHTGQTIYYATKEAEEDAAPPPAVSARRRRQVTSFAVGRDITVASPADLGLTTSLDSNKTQPLLFSSFQASGQERWRNTDEELRERRHLVRVQVGMLHTLLTLDADVVGETLFRVADGIGGEVLVVSDVRLDGSTKVLTLRSPLQVVNETDVAIDVMLRERHSLSPGYEYATVPPGATHGLPVIGVETTVLKIRPHDAGCAFSDDAIDWDGPDDVFFIAAPFDEVPTEGFFFRVERDLKQFARLADSAAGPRHDFIISAPMVVTNLLPVPLSWYLLTVNAPDRHRDEDVISTTLEPGQMSHVYSVPQGHVLRIRPRDGGRYGWAEYDLRGDVAAVPDTDGAELRLGVHLTADDDDRVRGTKFAFYAPYWFVNDTTFNLAYAQKGKPPAAGQGTQFSEDGYDSQFSQSSSNQVTRTQRSAPFMFSFGDSGKKKARILVDGSQWSDDFPIDSVGWSAPISVAASPERQNNTGSYEIGIDISPGPGAFNMTRVVTVAARFVLVNLTTTPFVYRQAGTETEYTIEPGQQRPWHWVEAVKVPRMQAKPPSPAYAWSGPFAVDTLGNFAVKSRDAGSGSAEDAVLWSVTVTMTKASLFIVVNDVGGFPPFRIENVSSVDVEIGQRGGSAHDDEAMDFVGRGQSLNYAWDYPGDPHELVVRIAGTDRERPYLIDKIKHKHPKLTSAGRVIRVRVIPNGPTRVVLIRDEGDTNADLAHLDPAVIAMADDTTISDGMTGTETEFDIGGGVGGNGSDAGSNATDDGDGPQFMDDLSLTEINITILDIGLSIMNDVPEEILYASFFNVEVDMIDSETEVKFEAQVGNLQIDNQLPAPQYPVFLAPKPSNELPVVKVSLIREKNRFSSVLLVKYFAVLIQELDLLADGEIVEAVLDFGTSLRSKDAKEEAVDFGALVGTTTMPSVYEIRDVSRSRQLYFVLFHLNPIQVNVTYSAGGMRDFYSSGVLGSILQALGLTFANFEGVAIRLNALWLEHLFSPQYALVDQVAKHYRSQLLRESYKYIGSVSFLGNPVGLVSSLGTGVLDFFHEPAKGIVQSPKAFGKGIGKGTFSLVKNTVYGVFNTTSNITGSISKGIGALSFDDDYIESRREDERSKPKHVVDGVASGVFSLGKGVFGGVTGIVTQPVKGARKGGFGGFFKGVGKGLVGVVVKPVAGAVDMVTKTAEGVKNTTTLLDAKTDRVRLPRCVGHDKVIYPYELRSAEGQDVMWQLHEGAYRRTDRYASHTRLGETVLLLTDRHIFGLRFHNLSVLWVFPIHSVAVDYDTSGIRLSLRGGHEFPDEGSSGGSTSRWGRKKARRPDQDSILLMCTDPAEKTRVFEELSVFLQESTS